MPEAWRISADAPDYTADDLTGTGARLAGARWNEKGLPVVYTSATIALACLETIVHLNGSIVPLNRYLTEIQIPSAVWAAAKTYNYTADEAVGWDAIPQGKVSLEAGSAWLRSLDSALLWVPSIIVPEERNLLINPAHPDAGQIKAIKHRLFRYDARLFAPKGLFGD